MSFIKTIKEFHGRDELLVTPAISDWLGRNQNWTWTDDDLEMVVSILGDNSNSVRHGRFGASSRGTCLRKQVFSYLGMAGSRSYDPILHNIFSDGHFRHLRWQIMGLKAGVFTHVETPVILKTKKMAVSIDALNDDDRWLFELKGAFRIPTEVPRNHLLQIHTYFYVSGYDKCSYLVEDKQTQRWKEWVVMLDPKIMAEVTEEIEQLNKAVDDYELPGVQPDCAKKVGTEYKGCPFKERCLSQKEYPVKGKWQ